MMRFSGITKGLSCNLVLPLPVTKKNLSSQFEAENTHRGFLYHSRDLYGPQHRAGLGPSLPMQQPCSTFSEQEEDLGILPPPVGVSLFL